MVLATLSLFSTVLLGLSASSLSRRGVPGALSLELLALVCADTATINTVTFKGFRYYVLFDFHLLIRRINLFNIFRNDLN